MDDAAWVDGLMVAIAIGIPVLVAAVLGLGWFESRRLRRDQED